MQFLTVSVALASYNGAKYLAQQLDSILDQTYPIYEIVISDDASQDGTLNIIKRYQDLHPKIKLLESKHTRGLNQNFQRAVSACKGEVIALSDQDNIWLPDKLKKMIERLETHQLVYSDSFIITEDNRPLQKLSEDKKYTFTRGVSPKEFYFYNSIFGHNTLFRRELLAYALPFPSQGLNYDGWLPFVAGCIGEIDYIDEPLVRYRLHQDNLTHPSPKHDTQNLIRIPKWKRIQQYNRKLIIRLEIFLNFKYLEKKEQRFLSNFITELKKQEHCFFNLRLLFMMLMNYKTLLHPKNTIKAINKSFSQAMGLKLWQLFRR